MCVSWSIGWGVRRRKKGKDKLRWWWWWWSACGKTNSKSFTTFSSLLCFHKNILCPCSSFTCPASTFLKTNGHRRQDRLVSGEGEKKDNFIDDSEIILRNGSNVYFIIKYNLYFIISWSNCVAFKSFWFWSINSSFSSDYGNIDIEFVEFVCFSLFMLAQLFNANQARSLNYKFRFLF